MMVAESVLSYHDDTRLLVQLLVPGCVKRGTSELRCGMSACPLSDGLLFIVIAYTVPGIVSYCSKVD